MAGESGVFTLGGVAIPIEARLTWSQTRERVDAAIPLEYSDLSAEVQQGPTTAVKRLLTISCSGWAPPGLDALARTSSHTLVIEKPTGVNTWTSETLTVLIWQRISYTEEPSAPGGGAVRWSITLREA